MFNSLVTRKLYLDINHVATPGILLKPKKKLKKIVYHTEKLP